MHDGEKGPAAAHIDRRTRTDARGERASEACSGLLPELATLIREALPFTQLQSSLFQSSPVLTNVVPEFPLPSLRSERGFQSAVLPRQALSGNKSIPKCGVRQLWMEGDRAAEATAEAIIAPALLPVGHPVPRRRRLSAGH